VIEYGPTADDPVEDQPRRKAVQSDIAERVVAGMLINRFRWVGGLGWGEFTGGRWVFGSNSGEAVRETTRAYIRQRVDDLRAQNRPEEAAAWKGCLRRQEVDDIVIFMRGMYGVLTDSADLDQHHDKVNCPNGVLDLRTGYLERHQAALLITKQTGAPYDAGARSSTWDAVLECIPADSREWLQVRLGQALSGYTTDSLVLTVGGGQNGKSAFMKAVLIAFGTYADMVSHRILLQTAGQHPTELMDLRGLRLALLEETPEDGQLDTHQLKTIIGTPKISARRMRQDSITFDTTHSLFINTNHYPIVPTTDHGTWRRLFAVRFPFRFVDPEAKLELAQGERWGIPNLKDRIERDDTLPAAVLAWVVEGARRWYEDASAFTRVPPSVQDATTTWRAESDVAYQFAMEYLEPDPHALIPSTYLSKKFNEFLETEGKRRWSNQTINSRLPQALKAAIGREAMSDRLRVLERHTLGITDPFDRHLHDVTLGCFVRAWEGIRLLVKS
jgi:putative DNA primase/helicase